MKCAQNPEAAIPWCSTAIRWCSIKVSHRRYSRFRI